MSRRWWVFCCSHGGDDVRRDETDVPCTTSADEQALYSHVVAPMVDDAEPAGKKK